MLNEMGNEQFINILNTKPELILSFLMILLVPFVMFPMAVVSRIVTRNSRRKFLKEILENPAVQERLKDPNIDFQKFIEEIIKQPSPSIQENSAKSSGKIGFFEKINQDITWDVSGIIGLIVTILLMIMVVSGKTDIPREILAGWTTILGFYFGKATK